MTQFISNKKENKIVKKTVFKKHISDANIVDAIRQPKDFEYVEYIGTVLYLGDLFIAWDGTDAKLLYSGVKGDEFE